ncbi:MAG: hypothetical protein KDD60_06400 [Bdellovibrionales bacterium]|nr:hypothetical protein [Bdellovibrionales bacterium]
MIRLSKLTLTAASLLFLGNPCLDGTILAQVAPKAEVATPLPNSEIAVFQLSLPFRPVKLEAIALSENREPMVASAIAIPVRGEEKSTYAIGVGLSDRIASADIVSFLLTGEDEDGNRYVEQIEKGDAIIRPREELESIRERILLLRKSERESTDELNTLSSQLSRLEDDAKIISGFEEITNLETTLETRKTTLKRLEMQLSQAKENLSALKNWTPSTDLTNMKVTLERQIRELQAKQNDE